MYANSAGSAVPNYISGMRLGYAVQLIIEAWVICTKATHSDYDAALMFYNNYSVMFEDIASF